MAQDPFAESVHHYDLDEGQFTDDLGLYAGFADRWGDPVLELGCGTGRVLAALAEAGHRVVGLDASPAMLQRAISRLEEAGLAGQVQLVLADMRTFHLAARFSWAFCALNSLMHLTTLEDQRKALKAVRQHLRPGGHLVLDLANPDPAWLLEPGERIVRTGLLDDPETGRPVVRQVVQRSDPRRQVLDLLYIYDEVAADGTVRRVLRPLALRFLFPFEARLLLEAAGFAVEDVYGTYEMDLFDGSQDRMVFVCRAVQEA